MFWWNDISCLTQKEMKEIFTKLLFEILNIRCISWAVAIIAILATGLFYILCNKKAGPYMMASILIWQTYFKDAICCDETLLWQYYLHIIDNAATHNNHLLSHLLLWFQEYVFICLWRFTSNPDLVWFWYCLWRNYCTKRDVK